MKNLSASITPIADLPLYYAYKDRHLNYTKCNPEYAKLCGLELSDEIEDKNNNYLPISNNLSKSEITTFKEEDILALKGQHQTMLDVHNYWGDVKVLISKKGPRTNQNNNIDGIYMTFYEIINPTIADINYFMSTNITVSKPVIENISRYFNNRTNPTIYITAREKQVLYHTVLGQSARQVGSILHLSPRTVETYLDRLKTRLNCNSKAELIETTINNGLLNKLINPSKNGFFLPQD